MNDEGDQSLAQMKQPQRFSICFRGTNIVKRELGVYDFDDPGLNWWLRCLDSTDGDCKITIQSRVLCLGLFADFSNCLRWMRGWMNDIRLNKSARMTILEQGVAITFEFKAEATDQSALLVVLDHGKFVGSTETTGPSLIAEFRKFFDCAVDFYEREGFDCADGRMWIETVFRQVGAVEGDEK